ncbi:MAG: caspase family protein [Planctomycetes bacterium]|nr:caspase family protein [Planctomycetota bacterium]
MAVLPGGPLAMSDPRIPDRFEVYDELAHGAGEILLRARDTLLQREVVLRLPAPELANTWPNADARATELRSARALAQVRHPGVVKLLDVLDTPDGALVVLEPVPGETLAEITGRDGRLDPERVREIGAGLAEALSAVHTQGVVHRGVSAENIVLRGDGTPCLKGFVFAKFVERDAAQSSIQFHGRDEARPAALPPHPAPEQLAGAPADARSDIFALGWVLYEGLTGAPPYPRDRDPDAWGEPADPAKLVPGVPKPLAAALLRALKKNPVQRHATAAEFRAALAAAPGAGSVAAAGVLATAPAPRPRGSQLVPLLAGVGIAVAGVALVLVLRGGGGANADGGSLRGLSAPDEPLQKSVGAAYRPGFSVAKALLIGISDYQGTGWPDLGNAVRDVEALVGRLEAIREWDGWQVKTLIGPAATKRAIKTELALLADATQDPDARVFVYFAGHGEKDELSPDHGYIVPADARPKAEDPGRDSYLLYQDGFDVFFSRTKAKHVLLALDCCYGGGVVQVRGDQVAPADVLLTRKAHLVFASSVRDQAASDGVSGGHSPFAQAFIDELGDPTKRIVTSSDLGARITRSLRETSGQIPNLGYRERGGGDGQFVFFTQRP